MPTGNSCHTREVDRNLAKTAIPQAFAAISGRR
jgi:hypothetical protein